MGWRDQNVIRCRAIAAHSLAGRCGIAGVVADSARCAGPMRAVVVLTAGQRATEGAPELDGHGVVEHGVDGRVDEDQGLAQHQVPQFEVGLACERIVHEQNAVRKPQRGEQNDDDNQHLDDLWEDTEEKNVNVNWVTWQVSRGILATLESTLTLELTVSILENSDRFQDQKCPDSATRLPPHVAEFLHRRAIEFGVKFPRTATRFEVFCIRLS